MEIINKEQKATEYCDLIDQTNSGVYSDDYDSYLAGFNEAEALYLKQLQEAKELLKECNNPLVTLRKRAEDDDVPYIIYIKSIEDLYKRIETFLKQD